jgi:hypothetical protein
MRQKIHKWDWWTTETHTLPTTLQQAEREGWEIFCVNPVGDISNKFCTVIVRRPSRERAK